MQKPFHHLVRGIFVKDDQVLLAQAIGQHNTFLPGGHIEFGESAKDALKREISEELDVACEVGRFLGLIEHKWESKGVIHCEINQLFEVISSEIHEVQYLNSKEAHLTFFWCDRDKLEEKNLQPYPLRNVIQKYLKGNQEVWWESTLYENDGD
ncbi:MAG: NUDIX domain-containing protein [Bacillaceae bacterium]